MPVSDETYNPDSYTMRDMTCNYEDWLHTVRMRVKGFLSGSLDQPTTLVLTWPEVYAIGRFIEETLAVKSEEKH